MPKGGIRSLEFQQMAYKLQVPEGYKPASDELLQELDGKALKAYIPMWKEPIQDVGVAAAVYHQYLLALSSGRFAETRDNVPWFILQGGKFSALDVEKEIGDSRLALDALKHWLTTAEEGKRGVLAYQPNLCHFFQKHFVHRESSAQQLHEIFLLSNRQSSHQHQRRV